MVKVAAVVPAAGRGARMGVKTKKQYLLLEGIPVVGRVLKVISDSPVVQSIILVTSPGEEAYCRTAIVERLGIPKIAAIVPGGNERQESVYNGLLALSSDTGIVIVHDGARPLLSPEGLAAVVDAAVNHGAATLAVPVKDTVKLAGEGGFVAGTLPRDRIWLTQTPQAFRYSLILEAHQRALETKQSGTDDAGLVELLGIPVKIVAGSYENLKITTNEDLIIASAIIRAREEQKKRKL
ncbi:MAG: 2-C-methyl-D-erythritol 4-phosphate cytidylyltransferase [Pelotomaculum sp. PtaU1.Bin035]|nr:MAG: 2-C-methyl-D-erythritol 4-phosphate cytidylyltransferase [Pelotomaculum sp. PtaU1.Bin035]